MQRLILAANGDDVVAQATVWWREAETVLRDRGPDWAVNLIAAVIIFIVGRWIARILKRFSSRLMTRAKVDDTLVKFLGNIVYALLLTFVVIAAIDRLGVDTTSFAAILAAAGLAVGLALQNSLANFAAGVMLILFKPFKVGDFVDAGGSKGVIEEIRIFDTLMRTGDNVRMIIPNGQITSATITNFAANDTRRIDLEVGCGYEDDLRAVKAYLQEVIHGDERILADPPPFIAVNELGASSVNFVVRPWVNTADYFNVRCDLLERIKLGFDERGFSIPYPQQDVHVHGVAAGES